MCLKRNNLENIWAKMAKVGRTQEILGHFGKTWEKRFMRIMIRVWFAQDSRSDSRICELFFILWFANQMRIIFHFMIRESNANLRITALQYCQPTLHSTIHTCLANVFYETPANCSSDSMFSSRYVEGHSKFSSSPPDKSSSEIPPKSFTPFYAEDGFTGLIPQRDKEIGNYALSASVYSIFLSVQYMCVCAYVSLLMYVSVRRMMMKLPINYFQVKAVS